MSSFDVSCLSISTLDGAGDLGDLQPALEPRLPAWHDEDDPEALLQRLLSAGRCSALVKVTGNLDNLLLSHSSWFTFRCACQHTWLNAANNADSCTHDHAESAWQHGCSCASQPNTSAISDAQPVAGL